MAGIRVGSGAQVRIQNNNIGEAVGGTTGTRTAGNALGIQLEGVAQTVEVLDNHIHNNRNQGILITGSGTQGALIHGNTIESNGTVGVEVTAQAQFHQISQNSITRNQLDGISLTAGGNGEIVAPVISSILQGDSASGNVEAPKGSRVELYADTGDEGAIYLGWAGVYGNTFSVPADVPAMPLHAIAIHPNGNTSKFGPTFLELPMFHMAFSSTRDNDPEIYQIFPGNEVAHRLTSFPGSDHSPRLTRDAGHLVWVTEYGGNPDIWMVSSDGGGSTEIVGDAAPDYDPAWNTANTRIAFVSERAGNAEIYTLYVKPGLKPGELAQDNGEASTMQPWIPETAEGDTYGVHFASPDDTLPLDEVAFYVGDPLGEFEWVILPWEDTQPGNTAIAQGRSTPVQAGWHTVDLGGILPPPEFVVGIRYAEASTSPEPDLAFATGGDGRSWGYQNGSWSRVDDLMIRAQFAATPRRLTQNASEDRHPAWSPADTHIAYTSDESGNQDLWLMVADGSDPQQLTFDENNDYQPTWSPDGTQIAFVSERDGNPEIYVMDLSGAEPTRLTNNLGFDLTPAWGNDGRYILFTSNRGAGMEIYSMRPDGSGARRVTTSLGQNSSPDTGTPDVTGL